MDFWRSVESMLFEISARDRWTFSLVTLLLFVTAVVAAYIPARRAARVDPAMALRSE